MKKNYIIILIIFLKFIYPVIGSIDGQSIENLSKNYTTLVDHTHGFHIVYESNKVGDILVENYQNRTLNINIGDTVFWSNDAVPDTRLTIISKQNLWKNITCGQYLCADLRWNYRKFGYTFNKSGIYNVYIQQFPRFNQTIIVGSIELRSNSNSISNTTTKKNDSNNITSTPITTKKNDSNNITSTPITTKKNSANKTSSVSNVKSFSIGSDTIILTIVLLSMIILSGKIKDE